MRGKATKHLSHLVWRSPLICSKKIHPLVMVKDEDMVGAAGSLGPLICTGFPVILWQLSWMESP